MSSQTSVKDKRKNNIRLAIALGGLALVFFIAFIASIAIR